MNSPHMFYPTASNLYLMHHISPFHRPQRRERMLDLASLRGSSAELDPGDAHNEMLNDQPGSESAPGEMTESEQI